jgi:hypothetical protein
MAERDNAAAVLRNHGSQAADELRRRQWALALDNALAAPKSEPWKLALASWMRASTQASRSWLTARQNLGTPSALSHNLSFFARHQRSSDPSYARLIALSSS